MLTNTFYGNSSTQTTKGMQREVVKTSEGLERLLELANRGEAVGSEKATKAIDDAIVKLEILKSRIVKQGELRQVIEELEKVAEEKMNDHGKRLNDVSGQIGEANQTLENLLAQRKELTAQIGAATSTLQEGKNMQDARVALSDYCTGDWDDSVGAEAGNS